MELERADLVGMIAYAAGQNHRLLGKRPEDLQLKIFAEKIVRHLELCGVSWEKKEPEVPHRTP